MYKGTVMGAINAYQIFCSQPDNTHNTIRARAIAEAQAKATWPIAYKAGWDKADKALHSPEVLRIATEELKIAELNGIRLVVKWLGEDCDCPKNLSITHLLEQVTRSGKRIDCWKCRLKLKDNPELLRR